MTVSRRDALLATAAVPASAWLLTLRAQPPGGAAPPGAAAGLGRDPLLAACLLIGGRKQIENCRFALRKLENEECRKFANAEIEEHEGIKTRLNEFGFVYPVQPAGKGPAGAVPGNTATPAAPPAGTGGTAGANPPAAGQPGAATRTMLVSVGKAPIQPGAAELILVDHEVAEQCIANYRKEMEPLTGLKLDKRFIGHQLDAHYELRDKAQTFARHASPAMQPVLAEGLKVIEAHIATCKQIMEELDAQKQQ
jgi:predicted outer membrane protein